VHVYGIFIHDLKEDVQKEVLKFLGLESAEEGNYDTIPVAVIPKPEEAEEDD